jgi:hypothetical protein
MKFKKKGGENNLREANISLVLNSYDDIFSDFDQEDMEKKLFQMIFYLNVKSFKR